MSQNPVRNVRGRSSPQGRAHAQSPDNPDKIIVGTANHMLSCVHVYMMRLARRSALRVRYNTSVLKKGNLVQMLVMNRTEYKKIYFQLAQERFARRLGHTTRRCVPEGRLTHANTR
jgi:hypothetical protein